MSNETIAYPTTTKRHSKQTRHCISISKAAFERLQAHCKANNQSMSGVISSAILAQL